MRSKIRASSVTALALCAAVCSPFSANAEEASTGWQSSNISIAFSGNAIKKDMNGVYLDAEAIYSGTAETEGNVAFTCYNGRYAASVALKPVDLEMVIKDAMDSRRRKIRKLRYTLNGETQKSAEWIYMPALKVYMARKQSTSAKLYNAAVRGDVVTLRDREKEPTELNLPKQDMTFVNFGKSCGLGKKKQS